MEDPKEYYHIIQTLDNDAVIIGFPRVEILPALVIAGAGILLNKAAIGMSVGFVVFIAIKYIRRKYGDNILSRIAFSHFTIKRSRTFFKRIPPYSSRYWRY